MRSGKFYGLIFANILTVCSFGYTYYKTLQAIRIASNMAETSANMLEDVEIMKESLENCKNHYNKMGRSLDEIEESFERINKTLDYRD
ncbi:MAG: hypothetical protein Q8N88_05035 [Nanoarchaeota archaeon]|nr:hypothetical protein [Nanoarchaeota archaeon]